MQAVRLEYDIHLLDLLSVGCVEGICHAEDGCELGDEDPLGRRESLVVVTRVDILLRIKPYDSRYGLELTGIDTDKVGILDDPVSLIIMVLGMYELTYLMKLRREP